MLLTVVDELLVVPDRLYNCRSANAGKHDGDNHLVVITMGAYIHTILSAYRAPIVDVGS